jgi:hypothetical protein
LNELIPQIARNPQSLYALPLPYLHPWLSMFVIIAKAGILIRELSYLRCGL